MGNLFSADNRILPTPVEASSFALQQEAELLARQVQPSEQTQPSIQTSIQTLPIQTQSSLPFPLENNWTEQIQSVQENTLSERFLNLPIDLVIDIASENIIRTVKANIRTLEYPQLQVLNFISKTYSQTFGELLSKFENVDYLEKTIKKTVYNRLLATTFKGLKPLHVKCPDFETMKKSELVYEKYFKVQYKSRGKLRLLSVLNVLCKVEGNGFTLQLAFDDVVDRSYRAVLQSKYFWRRLKNWKNFPLEEGDEYLEFFERLKIYEQNNSSITASRTISSVSTKYKRIRNFMHIHITSHTDNELKNYITSKFGCVYKDLETITSQTEDLVEQLLTQAQPQPQTHPQPQPQPQPDPLPRIYAADIQTFPFIELKTNEDILKNKRRSYVVIFLNMIRHMVMEKESELLRKIHLYVRLKVFETNEYIPQQLNNVTIVMDHVLHNDDDLIKAWKIVVDPNTNPQGGGYTPIKKLLLKYTKLHSKLS